MKKKLIGILLSFSILWQITALQSVNAMAVNSNKYQEQDQQEKTAEKLSAFNIVLFYAGVIGVVVGAFCSWTYFVKPENREPIIIKKKQDNL